MAQVLIRCAGSIVLGLTLCVATQAGEPWLPLSEGKRFTYQAKTTTRAAVVATTKEGTVTATVVRREKLGGQEWFRIEWRGGDEGLDGVHWVRSDAQGVQLGRSSDDHLWLVPATLEPGTTASEVRVQAGNTTLALKEVKVGQPEQLSVPFGSHMAIPAESRVEAPAARRTLRVWYCRGIGALKILEVVEAPATRVERELLLTKVEDGAVAGPIEQPVEQPETQPEQPEQPERPTAPAQPAAGAGGFPAALLETARAALAGQDEAFGKLEGAARTALSEAKRAQPELPGDVPWAGATTRVKDVEEVSDTLKSARITAKRGFSIHGTVRKSVLVVEGTLVVSGGLRDSLVVVIGDLELHGNVHDCLLLVSGRVSVNGNLHDAALACGPLQVNGNVHDCLLQPASLQALGNLHDDMLVGVRSPGGKNNRELAGPDLWAQFKGR